MRDRRRPRADAAREAAKLLSAVEARPGETALAIGAPYAGPSWPVWAPR
ncbi:hypothetical protein [Brevundimonas denitrificans]